MTILDRIVGRRIGTAAALLLAALSCPVHGAGSPAQHAARLDRFDGFLRETMSLYRKAGARIEPPRARFGYANADLIDPAKVTGETRHVLERYASYRAMLGARRGAPSAKGVFAAPPGSSAPEERVHGADDGRTDATSAIERALAAGNVWLTPGRVYRVSHPIAVPSDRIVASDGTGTILVAAGGPGFPQLPFDPGRSRSAAPNVFQIRDVQRVALRDFRLQTPIGDPRVPQAILHGVDIQNAGHVEVAGLEVRGFPRSQGILRVNSSSDVTIEDNLIHASYTRVLTRQVTGIEIDEARVHSAAGRGPRDSDHVRLIDNFILGLVLDPVVYLDTTLRGGKPLNDETTGIYLASRASVPTFQISGNVIADVGQGLDLATSDGHFADNTIERTPEFGLKMGHGASNNVFDRFVIKASGIAAVVIYGAPGEAAVGNRITNLRIDHPGAVIGLPGTVSDAILLTVSPSPGGSPASAATVSGNQFANIAIAAIPTNGGKQWRSAIACEWPADPGQAAPNRFRGLNPAAMRILSVAGCADVR